MGFPLYFELSLSPSEPETFQSSLKEWMSYAMNQESINTFKMHFEIQLHSLSWFVLLMSRPPRKLRPQNSCRFPELDCLSFVMFCTSRLHASLLNISPNVIMLLATNKREYCTLFSFIRVYLIGSIFLYFCIRLLVLF